MALIDHLLKTELALDIHGDWVSNDLEEEWENRQGILGNSLIMLFLAIENFLKFEICKIDSLLLLAGEPSKWGAFGDDKDFEELYIHQFDDLLVIHQEVGSKPIDADTKTKLEELRRKRNKYTHGLHREILDPSYIVESQAIFLIGLWGPEWLEEFRSVMLTEPLYGLSNDEEEHMQLLHYYKFFEKYLTKKCFRALIGMPEDGRLYKCPYCSNNAIESGLIVEANYSRLEPNKPDSTELKCWVCNYHVEIRRDDCIKEDCPGNVIFPEDSYYEHVSNSCLTCGALQHS